MSGTNVVEIDSGINEAEQCLPFRTSWFKNAFEPKAVPDEKEHPWEEFQEFLTSKLKRTPCNPCIGHDCEAKYTQLWSPVTYRKGGTRGNAGVEFVTLLVFDIDAPKKHPEVIGPAVAALLSALEGEAYFVHGSHSYSVTGNVRIVFPFHAPCPVADFPRVWRAARATLCQAHPDLDLCLDKHCKDVSRGYFTPSAPEGAHTYFQSGTGTPVDWTELLKIELPAREHPTQSATSSIGQAAGCYTNSTAATASGPQNMDAPADLDEIRNALRRVRKPESRDLARVIVNGEPLAQEGGRDTELQRASSLVATVAPSGTSVETLMAVLSPSMDRMPLEAEGRDYWDTEVRDMLERALVRKAERGVAARKTRVLERTKLESDLEGEPEVTRGTEGRPCTDLGNAERLADLFGDQLRFSDRWLSWDGTRWVPDSEATVHQLAHRAVRGIDLEALRCTDDARRVALRKHASASESSHRLGALISIARHVEPINARVEDFDRDPMLLNVQNGTIDLKTGELRPHRREDMLTQLAPVTFDPAATCPRWDQFLGEIQPNPEIRSYLQRFAGYCLTGLVSEEMVPFLHGGGRNGKGTFVETLMALLGTYAKPGAPDLLVAKQGDPHPADLADLCGARLVVCDETEQSRWLAEKRLKSITGGDTLKARRLYEQFFEFKPTSKVLLVGNHKPRVRGTDEAIWNRIRMVPFEVFIEESRRDRGLKAGLLTELPGILNWALVGLRAWQQGGLQTPAAVKRATEAYRQDEDHVGGFVADTCEPGGEVPFKEFFKRYTAWVTEDNGRPWSKKAVTGELRRLGYAVRETGKKHVNMVLGLRLKSQPGALGLGK